MAIPTVAVNEKQFSRTYRIRLHLDGPIAQKIYIGVFESIGKSMPYNNSTFCDVFRITFRTHCDSDGTPLLTPAECTFLGHKIRVSG